MKDELGWADFMVRSDRAISDAPPPRELAALGASLMAGCGINLYLRL